MKALVAGLRGPVGLIGTVSLIGVAGVLGAALVTGAALALGAGAAAAQVSEGLVAVNGTELFVKRIGAGAPVVVVHGGPVLEHGYLLPHLQPLAADRELILFDQRLSGRSSPSVPPETVRIASFVDDIEGLRQALGLGRIHLVGHSWGGLLAMHYAVRHGDNLASLVLLDSMAASSELWRAEEAVLAERVTDADRARQQAIRDSAEIAAGDPDAIARLLLASFAPQFHDRSRLEVLRLYVSDDYGDRSRQFGAMMVDLESFDLHGLLAAVETPTLVLYGDAEPGLALGGARLHATLPTSELVVIDAAGHFPFIEQPDAFVAAVEGFLDRVEAGR